jgi:hypothetical protein
MGNIARPDFTYEKIPAKPTAPTTKPDTLEQEMPDETRANAQAQQSNGLPQDSVNTDTIRYIAKHVSLSGRPRYLEGARYWLQWAGMPTQVYHKRIDGSPNDYNEDIWARPYWVNYLNGGSVYSVRIPPLPD